MIKCGMYENNITPPIGMSIPGYFEDRISTGIKDELFAKAMVIESNGVRLAVIAVDAVDLGRDCVLQIRERVSRFTKVLMENIMVTATHTHTGGTVMEGVESSIDKDYLAFLTKKSADAAIMAFNTMKPARIGFGIGCAEGLAFNRRYFMKDGTVMTNPSPSDNNIVKAEGPVDTDFAVIRIDDLAGEPIGVVSNFACHLDVVGGTEISADYPGELSRIIKKVLGEKTVSLFMTGASGNINHLDLKNRDTYVNPEHYRKMGRVLAGEAIKTRERITGTDDIEVNVFSEILKVKLRRPSKADIEWAEKVIADSALNGEGKGYANEVMKSTEAGFASEMLKLEKSDKTIADIEVQLVKIGELAIAAWPGEVFVEFGLELKERAPFKYVIIGELSNGTVDNYIPTRQAFKNGGYEPRLSCYINLEAEGGNEILESTLRLMNKAI